MATNLALPCSTSSVTWFKPNLSTTGLSFLSPFLASLALGSFDLASASFWSLTFLSFLVSGLYFESNLRSWLAIEYINYKYIVWIQEVEYFLTLILVNGLWELIDGGGNLESCKKNSLLTLDTNVLRPLDETSEVSLGLDVSTDSKVTWILLE
jgi:hypothetical protein